MNDLISRSALLEAIAEGFFKTDPTGEEQFGYLACSRIVREFPAADTEVVRHGRWIEVEMSCDMLTTWKCSECGSRMNGKTWNYCPNCGARMDGGAKNAAN